MEALIHVNSLLQTGEREPLKIEVLRMIVCSCLWHEPHSFKEMLEKAEKSFFQWADSKRTLKQCICSVLREKMDSGIITSRSGFFLLTNNGRLFAGKFFGLQNW